MHEKFFLHYRTRDSWTLKDVWDYKRFDTLKELKDFVKYMKKYPYHFPNLKIKITILK
jgi:hypothetical protein